MLFVCTKGSKKKGKHTRRNHARAHTTPTTGTTRASATRAYVLTCIRMTHTTRNSTQMHAYCSFNTDRQTINVAYFVLDSPLIL